MPHAKSGNQDCYRRLMGAVLAQAAKEGAEGDVGACDWLLAEDGAGMFADALDFDFDAIQRRARSWAEQPGGALVVCVLEG